MNHLETLSSLLHPAAITTVVQQTYGFTVADCRVLNSHITDAYQLETSEGRKYLKVFGAGMRSEPELAAEAEALDTLQSHGVPVAAAVRQKAGDYVLSLEAAEGQRLALLYDEATGHPLKNHVEPDAFHQFGELTAHLHLAARSLADNVRRRPMNIRALINNPQAVSRQVYSDRPEIMADLDLAARRTAAALAALPAQWPAYGFCHGDLQGWNVNLNADGRLTLFDFEYCGPGWLLYDLAVVANFSEGEAFRAFLDGYRKHNPDLEDHLDSLVWFRIANKLWMLGTRAQYVDRLGWLRFDGQTLQQVHAFCMEALPD